MGESKKPMPTAIVIYKGKAERVPPQIALNYREKNEKPGHILRCPDYFKTGCPALLKVVNVTPPRYSLQKHEDHKGCEYEDDSETFSDRIKDYNNKKLPVLVIKDSDMFSPKIKMSKNRDLTLTPVSPRRKRTGHSTSEYINTVYEFHNFLHNSSKELINSVILKLKSNNLLYEPFDFNQLLNSKPEHINFIQGFLDKRDITTLEEKGRLPLYAKHARHLDKEAKTRILLVHNGVGKERFKNHLKHLLEWINSRNLENRKLTTIKGRIVNRYKESNTIFFHVQDIDIKYREKEWNSIKYTENTSSTIYQVQTDSVKINSLPESNSNASFKNNDVENTETIPLINKGEIRSQVNAADTDENPTNTGCTTSQVQTDSVKINSLPEFNSNASSKNNNVKNTGTSSQDNSDNKDENLEIPAKNIEKRSKSIFKKIKDFFNLK